MLTQGYLKTRLHYGPDSGAWTWIVHHRLKGKIAGHKRPDGYRQIILDGVCYFSGRLACLYMTGKWPTEQMDHINRIRDDDRWVNLREATTSDNNANRKLQRNNASGYRGVSWDRVTGKWDVRVNRMHVGFFDDIEEAVTVRDDFASKMQGSFANLNSV